MPSADQARATEFLSECFRTCDSVSVEYAASAWGGPPEILTATAIAMGARTERVGGRIHWALPDGKLAVIIAAFAAKEAASAATARLNHRASTPIAASPATSALSTPLPPALAKYNPPTQPEYTNAELAERFRRINQTPLGRANPGLAMSLMSAKGVSTESALEALRITAGKTPTPSSTTTSKAGIDPATIFQRRQAECGHGAADAREVFTRNERANYRDGKRESAQSIFARRAAESGHSQ
jgi:hypothetical protein